MTEQERNERILRSRELIKWTDEDFDSDQQLHRKQPSLTKEAMRAEAIKLPKDFENIDLKNDMVRVFFDRKSSRIYTGEKVTLEQLSFMCWVQQGVKGIRGKSYATLRTVPSGGARHPFELYAAVLNVEGLESGLYHYLPMTHELELLRSVDNAEGSDDMDMICKTVCGQKWALKANVIFYYSIIPYRGEWRYGFNAHRVMMIDAGHITENLYIACSAMDLGTCAIGAVDMEIADNMFELDGDREYMFYCCPVGTVKASDESAEKDFYSFLKTEEQFYH